MAKRTAAAAEAAGSPDGPDAPDAGTPAKRVRIEEPDASSDDEEPAPVEEAPLASGDMYLETIDRSRLDFDFEKVCSVSLSNVNVYACLVCGKYFQGRGKVSHAYFHSLDEDHHVYINLQTLKVYVLPEGYEVTSGTLDDIKYIVNPTYTRAQVQALDRSETLSHDIQHKPYRPGFIGMNNIKQNDYLNVVVQALAHVAAVRNYFILEPFEGRPELAGLFSVLVRKIWNPRAFKTHVSPHELLQHVSSLSKKRFRLTEQADPFDFMNWLLNNLHVALGGSRSKMRTSIIHRAFQGKLRVEAQKITPRADAGDRLRFEADMLIDVQDVPFMFLALDLPPAPLFQDDIEKSVIPQVPLTSLLAKYDGVTTQELAGHRRRYQILELPPYLILHVKRMTKVNFAEEVNHTIVTFQPVALDMAPYTARATEPVLYDLVANITHESVFTPQGQEKHVYRVQLRDKARDEWLQIQDLYVEEIRREMLFLGESTIQIWERHRPPRPAAT
ncbi:uncharacterized protein V1510DRAFT_424318 [Dipodascopsis tothii]|uniref:uncharacterized protein n=1 Tax=Dipodascopsis tothii TaxID=44089 RepID=UPI0034CFB890